MNIVKETRFVWFVVLLLVVFAFVAHKKGDYDRVDNDRAFTETAPPPPPAPSSCFPGFAYGAFGKTSMDFGGNAQLDSWNSGESPYTYAGTQSNNNGDLGTNGCSSGNMFIHGSPAQTGDLYYGAGCPTSTLSVGGSPTYTGSAPQATNQTLPSVVVPALGTNLGACAGCVPVPNNTYTTVSGAVTFAAGTYVVDTLSAAVTVTSGPVLIYVTTSFAPASIANSTNVPANLIFEVAGTNPITLTGLSGYYALYAPDAPIQVHGNTTIYGSIVGASMQITGNISLHYDMALALVSTGGFSCTSSEISRSSPIVATIGGTDYLVQGTFNSPTVPTTQITSLGSIAGWTFPYISGHFRAKKTSVLTTAGTAYGAGAATDFLFDAADSSTGKPTGSAVGTPLVVNSATCNSATGAGSGLDGSCRRIFTNTSTPNAAGLAWHPTVVPFLDSKASIIGPLMIVDGGGLGQIAGISGGLYYQTMLRAVLNGKFGGVDRSTTAVIGPSTVAGNGARPTIAYVGGTDGMLHAICASVGGITASQPTSVCPRVGGELWAFMPRVELPLLATNTQRIDGAPRVVDAFGDFTTATADGTRSWHTILTFQTGYQGTSVGATYALDITDPAAPVVVWEYATPAAPGALETGVGLVVAAGQALKNGQLVNTAVIETNNGGTGGPGVVATALQIETGTQLWQFQYAYPSPPRGVAADLPMPASGVPGGAVGVDMAGAGTLTDVVFGDLYGDLWRVNILDGASRNGANTPLFSFSTNKRPIGIPPAIYLRGGSQFAAFASGGFVDPTLTRWSGNTQYLVAAKLSRTGPTVDEVGAVTGTVCSATDCPINQTLTSGDRQYGQILVVGGQLFLTSNSNDVNTSSYGGAATSHVVKVDTTTNVSTTYVLSGGTAGSLTNKGTTIFNASATQQGLLQNGGGAQVSATSASDGNSVDTAQSPKITRNLWLRTQ